MHLRSALKFVQANFIAGNAVKLISDPGVGKSSLAWVIAKWWMTYVKSKKPNARVGISLSFLATANPISFTGMPWKSTKSWVNPVTGEEVTFTVTDPAIPVWFLALDLETNEIRPASTFDSVLLVLEEWGQGSVEAKRAAAEVYYAGGTPPFYLPIGKGFGSPRLALTNSDARDGVTKEMDFIINRGVEGRVNGDYDIWHDDFADKPYQWQGREWNVMGISKLWAKRHPNVLFEAKPKVQGPWCTARSFTAQDRFVQSAMELNGGVIPLDDPWFAEGCAGHCGMPQTQSVLSFYKFQLDLPSYESIVKDPSGVEVPTKADMQMLIAYELAGKVQREDIGPVLQYIERLPRDFAITFTKSLMRRDAKSYLNTPAMSAWIARHAYLVSIIGSLTK